MAFGQVHTLTITTASSSGSATTDVIPYGFIESITYTTGTTGFTTGCDFVVTTVNTSQTVWSQLNVESSVVKYPRAEVHTTAGTTSDGKKDKIMVVGESIKVDVTSAGDAKTGTFKIVIS